MQMTLFMGKSDLETELYSFNENILSRITMLRMLFFFVNEFTIYFFSLFEGTKSSSILVLVMCYAQLQLRHLPWENLWFVQSIHQMSSLDHSPTV